MIDVATHSSLALFHQDPITVQFIFGLQEITPICPNCCEILSHYSCASAPLEAGNILTPMVMRTDFFSLTVLA